YWQVLSDSMAKDRTEHTDVEAATITDTDDGLVTPLIGDAQPRRKILEAIIDAHIDGHPTDTGYVDCAIVQIQQAAVASFIDRLWIIDFPAQPVVQCELGGYAPSVLPIEKLSLLVLFGTRSGAHVARDTGCFSKKKR